MGTTEEQNCYIFKPVSHSSPLPNIVSEPFAFRRSSIRLALSILLFEEKARDLISKSLFVIPCNFNSW
uniref:Uncharacterized protein n=1 Tax=Picea glauca TaxID=3330 RepID=A0A101M3W5_PICGL|nr:hypothetical protein ABT39_MTgene317 [Picea glauca]